MNPYRAQCTAKWVFNEMGRIINVICLQGQLSLDNITIEVSFSETRFTYYKWTKAIDLMDSSGMWRHIDRLSFINYWGYKKIIYISAHLNFISYTQSISLFSWKQLAGPYCRKFLLC